MSDSQSRVRPEESLAKMVASLKEKTGRSLEEWRDVIAQHGWQKHGEVVAGIKSEYGVSHGYANQIALHSKEKPSDEDPIAVMFMNRDLARPIYDELLTRLQNLGSDLDFAPKKGYVSVRRKKQFAILQPASNRLDVGIQLKGVEPTGRLEPSGSFNAMLTHRVRVASPQEVDDELMRWLEEAYRAAG